jgi:hypothetical protein
MEFPQALMGSLQVRSNSDSRSNLSFYSEAFNSSESILFTARSAFSYSEAFVSQRAARLVTGAALCFTVQRLFQFTPQTY